MLLMPCGLAHVRTLQLWIARPVVLIYTRIQYSLSSDVSCFPDDLISQL